MKKLIFFLLIFFSCKLASAQASGWLWGRCDHGYGSLSNEGMACATDPSGNIYITGMLGNDSAIFGNITLRNHYNINGFFDIYLVKYDPSGNVLWAQSFGGTETESGNAICTDQSGNVYLTGYYNSDTVRFGANCVINQGSSDAFVAKFDAAGNSIWARQGFDTGSDQGNGISADAAGNIFVAGQFNNYSITFGSVTLSSPGSGNNPFLVKYDSAGNVLWAKSGVGGTGLNALSVGCTSSVSGSVIATGYFSGSTLNFGTFALNNSGSTNLYVVKYDASGNVMWAKCSVSASTERSIGVVSDANGNSFSAGYYLDQLTLGTFTILNWGSTDVLIAKFDINGNVVWLKRQGDTNYEYAYGIALDNVGNLYVEGGFLGTYTLVGSFNVNAPANSADPIYIAKYDSSGHAMCADVLSSGGDDESGISVDNFGNVYFTGDFMANFNSYLVVGPDTLYMTGGEDIFVAKYSCPFSTNLYPSDQKKYFTVFPNPSNGKFSIELPWEENVTANIYNSEGKMVFESSFKKRQFEIDLSNEPSGIYFLSLNGETKTESHILLKE